MRLTRSTSFHLLVTLASLALLLAWDAGHLDLFLARDAASGHAQFNARDQWLLSIGIHDAGRFSAMALLLWLAAGVWWPTGVLARMARAEVLQWLITTLLSLALVSLLKQSSHTSCPWDLAEFGGHAHWVSHWAWRVADGGPGHCFPAGNASAGFAFFGGYFVLRKRLPGHAALWLAGTLAAGLVLGMAQQLRGAHFMSHTLWTGWLCWTVSWLADLLAIRFRRVANPGTPALPAGPVPAS